MAPGLAPLGRAEAKTMIRATKAYRVLEGLRGQKAVDLDAVEDLLLRVSRLAADFPEITAESFSQMDLNADGALDDSESLAAQEAGLLPKT